MNEIRVGTRPSKMALFQAHRVADAVRSLGVGLEVRVVELTTEGDRWGGPLAALGGKGAFVRELDRAQLAGEFDIGVHCLKDIPGDVPLPDGLTIAAYQPREDPHDALIARAGGTVTLDDLPAGAKVGTSSVRRIAQITRHRPDLRAVPIRGNADTRLRKLDGGELDAVILAVAGLQRIGAADRISSVIPADVMLPAVGAGVIVLTTRTDDAAATELAARLDHDATRQAATAERALLAALNGHCHSPIAGHATLDPDGTLQLTGAVYTPDGTTALESTAWSTNPTHLGTDVATSLLTKGAHDLIADTAI